MTSPTGSLPSTAAQDRLSDRAVRAIEARRADLIDLSLAIHKNPETAYQERSASRLLSNFLQQSGFRVTLPYGGLETAFRADASGREAGPTIGLLAEYDALPELGHGCGHNLIAMMATAAAVGIRSALNDLRGSVAVIGTPAEEGGGGKVALVRAGAFADIDFAMLVHPSSRTLAVRSTLAANRADVEFFGKAAHAAAQPHEGISALDGVLQTFSNINALRLRLRPDARIHGIIAEGGKAANVIPDYAIAKFSVRALDRAYQQEVLKRFIACAEGAALATGTRLKITVHENAAYENMVASTPVADRWKRHMQELGQSVAEAGMNEALGSTDMGNVSQVLPAIQPYVAIGPDTLPYHSVLFRSAAETPGAHEAAIAAAKAMALTALDLMLEPELLGQAREEFAQRARRGEVKGKN